MSVDTNAVNPHPLVHPVKLARIGDHLLQELIRISQPGVMPAGRLQLAGVPPLPVLQDELIRRTQLAAAAA